MDTKIITAQNERTQKLLTSGLVIVDAAVEPLRVLKVLMEGLGTDVKAGLWLTNFRGVPVARTLSPFDLVYLDANYRVVHCIEISTEGEYEPFRGDPASALVLPPKVIVATKTRPGDRLQFRAIDETAASLLLAEKESRPARRPAPQLPPAENQPGQPAHFFNSAFPVPPPQQVGSPLDQFLTARSAKSHDAAADSSAAHPSAQNPPSPPPSPSGRLAKTARSVMDLTPTLRPAGDSAGPEETSARFYSGSVATAVEPAGYTALAHPAHSAQIEQRMSVVATPAEFVTPPQDAQAPMVPSGRLRRAPHLAPEPAPITQPATEPSARPAITEHQSPAQSVLTQAAVPAPIPEAPPEVRPQAHPESSPKPTIAIVIPIKPEPVRQQQPEPAAPRESAAPERAPASPTPIPSPVYAPIPSMPIPATAPAASIPTPIPMVPAAESAPTFALAPVAKASPAAPARPIAASPAPFPPSPAVAAQVPQVPQISQPPVRRPAVQSNEIVESPLPAAAPAASYPSLQISPNGVIAPISGDQPTFERTTGLVRTGPTSIQAADKAKPSWDVKLLYSLFPEFDPSRPPEIRIPRIHEKLAADIDEEDERPSRKLQVLCWLYPHLHLDQVKQKRAEERRAPRLPMPGLVAYFFTGGSPRPHPIKDISVTGFYMQTDERWLPGTVIRVTLQMVNTRSDDGSRDSVTVLSRVVRWGPDGGGFEFVLPGFMET